MRAERPLDPTMIATLLAQCTVIPDVPVGPHIDREEYVDYEGGYLGPEDAARVDAHLASCPDCSIKMIQFMEAMVPWQGTEGERRVAEASNRVLSQLKDASLSPNVIPMRSTGTRTSSHSIGWGAVAAGVAAVSLALNSWLAVRIVRNKEAAQINSRALTERNQRIAELEQRMRKPRTTRTDIEGASAGVSAGSSTPHDNSQHSAAVPKSASVLLATIRLQPGGAGERRLDSAGVQSFPIMIGDGSVALRLELPSEAVLPEYTVTVINEDSGEVLQRNRVRAYGSSSHRSLTLTVSAATLRPGRHTVEVRSSAAEPKSPAAMLYAFQIRN